MMRAREKTCAEERHSGGFVESYEMTSFGVDPFNA